MILVVDASVAVKWFLRFTPPETGAESALAILASAVREEVRLWQPPHFVAEVAGVLARLKPEDALLDVRDLLELPFEQLDDDEVYARGIELAVRLNHHLFDTLYHALALSDPDAILVTADRRYHRVARSLGQIDLLENWRPS